jgi:hypothetical protein
MGEVFSSIHYLIRTPIDKHVNPSLASSQLSSSPSPPSSSSRGGGGAWAHLEGIMIQCVVFHTSV